MMISKVQKYCFIVLALLFWGGFSVYAQEPASVSNEPAAVSEVKPAAATAVADSAEAEAPAKKQKTEVVALKNNLLYDAAATPNLQLEIKLAPKWSLELGVGFNPFPLDDKKFPKWRHIMASIAPRYWFCNVFNRGFVSVNVAYAHYNVAGDAYPVSWMYKEVKDGRYQGDAIMAGASFGWHFPIKPYFSIELEGGVDAGYSWYDRFECKHCGDKTASGGRWFVLPKVGVNLSFPLVGNEASLAKRCDCEKLEEAAEALDKASELIPDIAAAPKEEQPAEPVEPVEPIDERMAMGSQRIQAPILPQPEPVVAFVPFFVPKVDAMYRLRSRLLRSEEEYEPYNSDMALGADPRNVFIFFEVNITKMDRNFIQNDLLMDSIINILGEVQRDSMIHISHIRIVGFASFDGRQSYNNYLAGSRAKTIKEYMQSVYPALNDSVFDICNGGESWAELKYALQSVQFEGRDEVFEIMDTEPDPDIREKKIKALHGGATYRYMRDELRHIMRNLGCITIYIERK